MNDIKPKIENSLNKGALEINLGVQLLVVVNKVLIIIFDLSKLNS